MKAASTIKQIADESYKAFFVATVGVAMFAHYVAASIVVYLTVSMYVLFKCLPLLHHNKPQRKRVVDLIFLGFLTLAMLIFVIDVNFQ